MRATTRGYVVSPGALGRSGADPAGTDRLSIRYLIAVALRLVREVGLLARRAEAAGRPLAHPYPGRRDPLRPGGATTSSTPRVHHRYRRRGLSMSDTPRAIDLSIEVPGTPEEVWRAIADRPGHLLLVRAAPRRGTSGRSRRASFGPGPEMQVDGRVAAWEPPHRVVFDGGEGAGGLAFEWLVEAGDGGSCVVRLVNTGFGDGGEWDDQYDAMQEGWKLFLLNLRLHLEHFRGRDAASALPVGMWPMDPQTAWDRLTGALGVPSTVAVGDRLDLDGGDGARLAGTVVDVAERRLVLLLDEPAPGTGFVVAEGPGPGCVLSVWAYLYGDDRDALAADVGAAWQRWLSAQTPAPA